MEKMTHRKPTQFTGVYSRRGIHKKGKHKGKLDTVFDVSFKDAAGEKVWKKVGWQAEGISGKVASQLRGEWIRDIRLGKGLPWRKRKIPLFSEMASLYLDWSDQNKAESNDHSRYKHLEPLGSKRLSEISSFDLERLKSDLTKKGLAPASVKHVLILVRQIFNKAIAWGKYEGKNPVKGVKLPILNNRRERFFSYEEADLLLKELAPVSPITHDMTLLSLHTGVRAGEIFNLKGQDLDFENGLIRIMDTKNKANRSAYMTQATKEMLKSYLPKEPGEYIFQDQVHGGKIKEISKTFREVANRLFNKNVEDSRQRACFHTARHSFASWLAIRGVPILAIRDLLGHRTLAMTERYSHLSPDMKRQATVDLEADFNQVQSGNSKIIPLAAAQQVPVDR